LSIPSSGTLASSNFEAARLNSDFWSNESILSIFPCWFAQYWARILAVSLLVLVPCFWHARIEAGDLGSHTYNAWLAQLIERGQVSGLAIVWMWHNALFDLFLTGFGKFLSLHAAEKLAVSLSVLIFFWGSFAFVAAINGRAPWVLIPCLALFSYGWTFEAGFLNYYLSIGLSLFALAIFWRGRRWEKLAAFLPAPLVLFAHAMGLAWLIAAAAYLALYAAVPRAWRHGLLALGILGLVALRWFFYHHYVSDPETDPFYWFTGADQLALASPRYWFVAIGLLAAAFGFIGWEMAHRGANNSSPASGISIHLYILALAGAFLLPDGMHIPPYPAALALITPRLTLIAAIMLCSWLGSLHPRWLHLYAFGALAIAFFATLYRDTGRLNSMEARIEQLVRALPPDQRVLGTILAEDGSRFIVQHMLDRACIGHCFSYGNYEPPSEAFRVRVLNENPFQMEDGESSSEMEDGTYVVQPEDLPAYQVFQCGPKWSDLCIRPLKAGQQNDQGAFHPQK
jgi:hypothetical protein